MTLQSLIEELEGIEAQVDDAANGLLDDTSGYVDLEDALDNIRELLARLRREGVSDAG